MTDEFGELDAAEKEMIRKHRAGLERDRLNNEFRLKAIEVAARYEKWLQENGRGDSYSTFINEFDYQERDGNEIHEFVVKIRKAATRTPPRGCCTRLDVDNSVTQR